MSGSGTLDPERGERLLAIARAAVEEAAGAGAGGATRAGEGWLGEERACFVTLELDGRLRGCIGSLLPCRPLIEDLRANARAAAVEDPRFPPLAREEASRVRIEVSLLSPLEEIEFADETELAAALRPGVDGACLEHDGRRGAFLPQVWESLPEPPAFVAQLKRKAGLPLDFWSSRIRAWRFTVEKWKETGTG